MLASRLLQTRRVALRGGGGRDGKINIPQKILFTHTTPLSIDTQVLYSKILSTFQDFEGQKDSKRHRDVIPLNLGRGPNAVVDARM